MHKALGLFTIFLLTLLLSGCAGPTIENTEPLPVESAPSEYEEIEWGAEVLLDEMIEMAQEGRITEIQWHVLPNILRAQASDGSIYHLRNENKGVDLRNTLIESGVEIGKNGVEFKHVF
jgi:hypothetical protein